MKFYLSQEYMSECYDQFRKYGSKWLLIERLVGAGFILLGIVLYIYANGETNLPLVLIAIGVFEIISNYIKKYFWLRRHRSSKLFNAEVELQILEDGINGTGPFSKGHFNWNGIEKVSRTPNGVLVWPQKGIYWYLPEKIVGKEAIETIQSKVA